MIFAHIFLAEPFSQAQVSRLAQWLEHWSYEPVVTSSNAKKIAENLVLGRNKTFGGGSKKKEKKRRRGEEEKREREEGEREREGERTGEVRGGSPYRCPTVLLEQQQGAARRRRGGKEEIEKKGRVLAGELRCWFWPLFHNI